MTTVHRPAEDVEVSASDLEERLALLQGISIFFTLPDREVRRLAHKLQCGYAADALTRCT